MDIDLDKGAVLFSLSKFDEMREYTKKLKSEVERERKELEEVKERVLEVAIHLEIFLAFLAPLDEFKKAVHRFNEQSDVARIIIRKDGKVKVQILEEKTPDKETSKKEN